MASSPLTAEGFEAGAEAAWTAGDYDEAIRLRERAYSEYLAAASGGVPARLRFYAPDG
jgi:hypothetical protein